MTTSTIAPGTPATMGVGSDSYAMVVVAVSASGKTVKAARHEGAEPRTFSLRANGGYVMQGTGGRSGIRLHIGKAVTRLDPSF